MKSILFIAMLAVMVVSVFAADKPESRTWTSTKGTQIEAALFEDKGQQIVLLNSKSGRMAIEFNALSAADMDYIRNLRAKVEQEKERELALARKAMFTPTGMSVAEFHATRPTRPIVFAASAKLDDYFNYEFRDDEAERLYWSVSLDTPEGDIIGNGYILKKGRGEDLFALIKDGKQHPVLVRVKYNVNSEDSSCFLLEDFQPRSEPVESVE